MTNLNRFFKTLNMVLLYAFCREISILMEIYFKWIKRIQLQFSLNCVCFTFLIKWKCLWLLWSGSVLKVQYYVATCSLSLVCWLVSTNSIWFGIVIYLCYQKFRCSVWCSFISGKTNLNIPRAREGYNAIIEMFDDDQKSKVFFKEFYNTNIRS